MSAARPVDARIVLAGLAAVLVVAWLCYRPALSGAFELDDLSNLSGLAYVQDADSALDFTLSGEAGPTGRPLALLTFALQADAWEEGASAFLSVNLLIHLLNALLLAWCLFQLATLNSVERRNAMLVAAAAASVWVTMPLLASASLLVVQRMTTLSATFALLGLGGYLFARKTLADNPLRGLVGMSGSLVAGTVLSALCKESGLLLPAFVLVIESTILGRPTAVAKRTWRLWQSVFLALPLIAILLFLASRAAYPDWLVARRDFNAWERLLTESRILWSYIGKALVGFPAKLGIYQTPPDIHRSLLEPLTLLASVAWVGLAVASLIWRRRWPLFALAVLWYLAGHLVESTVVPLELYFEHRNYLAIIGPVFAVCAALLASTEKLRRMALMIIPIYLLLNAFFLYSFASLRGQPAMAANYWALRYPDSVRAVTTLASQDLVDWGPTATLKTLDRFVSEHPGHAYLRIQELNLRCQTLPDGDHGAVLQQLYRDLPAVNFTYTAGTMLSELFTTVSNGGCRGVTTDTVKRLAAELHGNPRYAGDPRYNQFHYKLMAAINRVEGDYGATVASLGKAISYGRTSELNMMMVTLQAGAGEFEAAQAYIDTALRDAPRHPLRAIVWRKKLLNLREYVAEVEKYSQRESPAEPGTENDEP